MVFEQLCFDQVESILVIQWVFYRQEGMDLRYLGGGVQNPPLYATRGSRARP